MAKKFSLLLILTLVFLGGCATKQLMVDKTDGISKEESRILAVQYMGGVEPCGFRDNYDTYRWDFRIARTGYETTQKHVYVSKFTGNVVEGIR